MTEIEALQKALALATSQMEAADEECDHLRSTIERVKALCDEQDVRQHDDVSVAKVRAAIEERQ